MIAFVRGQVVERTEASVVVDVHGIGHRVHIPAGFTVPPPGREVTLHTSLQVREDSMTLYGFADQRALQLFELLLTSSGIGPKIALAALSTLSPSALASAIADGDLATLTSVPGIGRKVAERLVLELRERVESSPDAARPGSGVAADASILPTVREALAGFGFSPTEVRAALDSLDVVEGEDSGSLLRRALQALGGTQESGR